MIETDAVSALTALAHADRLAAFRLLVRAGPSGLPSGEIAGQLGIPPTRMSFHLSTLERAGLARSWREGRNVRYALEVDRMRALLAFLTEDCCAGMPELCGADLAGAGTCSASPESATQLPITEPSS